MILIYFPIIVMEVYVNISVVYIIYYVGSIFEHLPCWFLFKSRYIIAAWVLWLSLMCSWERWPNATIFIYRIMCHMKNYKILLIFMRYFSYSVVELSDLVIEEFYIALLERDWYHDREARSWSYAQKVIALSFQFFLILRAQCHTPL